MTHYLSGVTAKGFEGMSGRTPLVGIGHSHLIALRYADKHRAETSQPMPVTVTLIQLLDSGYQPNLILESGGNFRFNRSITERLDAASDGARFIFDCISGNEYHSFGLVRHPHPFDFVLPQARDIPLDKTAEVIPFALVDEMLRSVMGHAIETLRALREATRLPIYHVQSPPPIPSERHIRTHPDTFRDKIEAHGVAAYGLRYKLWLLQSSIYRSECEKLGIAFLPAPDAALDENGLLRQETWNPDPTHANRLYGELVFDQLVEVAQAMGGEKKA